MKRAAANSGNARPAKQRASAAAQREALQLALAVLVQRAAAARNQREQLALVRHVSDVRHQLARLNHPKNRR